MPAENKSSSLRNSMIEKALDLEEPFLSETK
jgi:hypothetical protein